MEEGFDVAWANEFADGKLLSHAHTEPILYLMRDSGLPVVPLFVNAVHPTVAVACALLRVRPGAAPRDREATWPSKRIVLCASGGLSHFSPSHPWAHHVGTRYVGDISVEFDRQHRRLDARRRRPAARRSSPRAS